MSHGLVNKWLGFCRNKLDPRNSVVRTLFFCVTVIIIGFGFYSYWSNIRPLSVTPPTEFTRVVEKHEVLIKDVYIQQRENLSKKDDLSEQTIDPSVKQIERRKVIKDESSTVTDGRGVSTDGGGVSTAGGGMSTDEGLSISTLLDGFTEDKNEYSSAVNEPKNYWDDPKLDILHMQKPEYNARFKNPCWYEPLPSSNPYKGNKYISFSPAAKDTLAKLTDRWEELYDSEEEPKRLRCLPYFLIIGQPKCGSTDLFWKVAKHPDIDTPPIKELHWFSRNRQGRRFSYTKIIPFEDYVDMFDKAAVKIEERVANINQHKQQHPQSNTQVITGEASVSVMWDNSDWMMFPENRHHQEPLYINPHYLHHIIPDAKLIVILREPIDRMYSDYLYFHANNKSPDNFHRDVKNAIKCYSRCMQMHSIRYCVHNKNITNRARIRLRVGLYSVFLKDWFSMFPRQQFFILRLEDYSEDSLKYIKQIYKFLDVRDLTPMEENLITDSPISNVRKAKDREIGGMYDSTRKLLKDFYRPFNIELAKLLQDKRYLWLDKQYNRNSMV